MQINPKVHRNGLAKTSNHAICRWKYMQWLNIECKNILTNCLQSNQQKSGVQVFRYHKKVCLILEENIEDDFEICR